MTPVNILFDFSEIDSGGFLFAFRVHILLAQMFDINRNTIYIVKTTMRSLRVIHAVFEWPFSKMLFHQGTCLSYLKAAAAAVIGSDDKILLHNTHTHTLAKDFFLPQNGGSLLRRPNYPKCRWHRNVDVITLKACPPPLLYSYMTRRFYVQCQISCC